MKYVEYVQTVIQWCACLIIWANSEQTYHWKFFKTSKSSQRSQTTHLSRIDPYSTGNLRTSEISVNVPTWTCIGWKTIEISWKCARSHTICHNTYEYKKSWINWTLRKRRILSTTFPTAIVSGSKCRLRLIKYVTLFASRVKLHRLPE